MKRSARTCWRPFARSSPQRKAADKPRLPPLSERIVSYSAEAVRAAEEAADDISIYFGDWPFVVEWMRREISDPAARAKGLNNAAAFAAIFAVGWLAEYLLWRILAGTAGKSTGRRSDPGLPAYCQS